MVEWKNLSVFLNICLNLNLFIIILGLTSRMQMRSPTYTITHLFRHRQRRCLPHRRFQLICLQAKCLQSYTEMLCM